MFANTVKPCHFVQQKKLPTHRGMMESAKCPILGAIKTAVLSVHVHLGNLHHALQDRSHQRAVLSLCVCDVHV